MNKSEILAELINKNGYTSFLEVGVWKGENMLKLLELCPKLTRILGIDAYSHIVYKNNKDNTSLMNTTTQDEFDAIFEAVNKKLPIARDYSVNAARRLPDKSFDVIFIDASHDYESVKADIEAWLPKAKFILCGDDYCETYPGVVRAVNELVFNKRWQQPGKLWIARV